MNELNSRVEKVWGKFCDFCKKHRSYKGEGYVPRKKSFISRQIFWSEQDVVLHLSRFLGKEFGEGWVHNELSVAKHTFKNFSEKEKERGERIDIVVSNPENHNDNWRYHHDIFIEVKQITKGMIFNNAKKKIEGAKKDCEKLSKQMRNNRCRHAFVCIVSDDPEKSRIDERTINQWKSDYEPVKILLWPPSSAQFGKP